MQISMKIMFLISALNKGGAERQLVTLANLLKQRGHEVKVAVSYMGGYHERILSKAEIPIINLKKKSRWDVAFLFRLGIALYREKPQILHSYMPSSNVQASLVGVFFRKIKIVWGIRASNMDLERYSYSKAAKIIHSFERMLSNRVDLIISNSESAKACLISRGFKADNITVISNGINTNYFVHTPCDMNEVHDEPLKIGVAARIDPMKGYEIFLQAVRIFKETYPEQKVKFIIAGGGDAAYFDKLKSLTEQLQIKEQITWLGEQNDMVRVLNSFDIYSSNSIFGEGFSNSIGEAMACEVPCVVTDVGDSAKIIGDTGILVKPDNSQELAEAWFQMINGDIKALGKRARQRTIENFSLEKLADDSEQALMGVLSLY